MLMMTETKSAILSIGDEVENDNEHGCLAVAVEVYSRFMTVREDK
jgi:hypothetical protein